MRRWDRRWSVGVGRLSPHRTRCRATRDRGGPHSIGVVPEATRGTAAETKAKCHFDFIEVGTSDWGTIAQYCAGDVSGSWLAGEIQRRDLRQCRGLCVEPVKAYLDALPNLKNVTKVCAAMDEHSSSGTEFLHFVAAEKIDANMGRHYADLGDGYEVDVVWYAKSLSSLGQVRPDLKWMLWNADLLECRPCTVFNWADLCANYGVRSVEVVQLDCEGKDCAILRGILQYCSQHPEAYPRIVQFELNHLTPQCEAAAMLEALCGCGYAVRSQSDNNVVVERGWSRAGYSDNVGGHITASGETPANAAARKGGC